MGKYNINELYVGQYYEKEIFVTENMGVMFAEISKDYNPIHLDSKVAKESRFGRKIVHGMLIGSYFSGIIGNEFPGAGTIYVSQKVFFRRPVYYDVKIKIKVEITGINKEKSRVFLKTQCISAEEEILVDGEAEILLDN